MTEQTAVLEDILFGSLGDEELVRAYLKTVAPAVALRVSRVAGELPVGATKLGGGVDLPAALGPPLAPGTDTWLMLQVNLSDIPEGPWTKRIGSVGMLYFYAHGTPVTKPETRTGRDLRVFAERWTPTSLVEHENALVRHSFPGASRPGSDQAPGPGQVLEGTVERAVFPERAFAFPSWNTLSAFNLYAPPHLGTEAELIGRFIDSTGVGDPVSYAGFVEDVRSACRARNVPSVGGLFMFGHPSQLDYLPIDEHEWFRGDWMQLFGLHWPDDPEGPGAMVEAIQVDIAEFIHEIEIYTRCSGESIDLSCQHDHIRWDLRA